MSYRLQNRYQDSGWEEARGYESDNLRQLELTAKQLSENSIAWGMIRVVGPGGEIYSVFSGGQQLDPETNRRIGLVTVSPPEAKPHDQDAIFNWFGLSYANYHVVPRLVLQHMPPEWQAKWIELMDELEERYGHLLRDEYRVRLKDERGGFRDDPLSNYRHGKL